MQTFLRFCAVGGAGFIVDSLAFINLNNLLDNVMLARVQAFWLAAIFTWLGQRLIIFKPPFNTPWISQLSKHMLSVHVAGGLNLLIFACTMAYFSVAISFCIGNCAGLCLNYFCAQKFVFSRRNRAQ